MDILDDMGVSKLSAKVFFFLIKDSFKKNNHDLMVHKCTNDNLDQ